MNTHDIEPLKYGSTKTDDYVTGWNDCYAAFQADRQRRGEPVKVSTRHPAVIKWRNSALQACAKIADDYGMNQAAEDMRAMLTTGGSDEDSTAMVRYPSGHSLRDGGDVDSLFFGRLRSDSLSGVANTAAPQPAEPVKHPSYDTDCCQGHKTDSDCKCAAHDAEPVRAPSEKMLHYLWEKAGRDNLTFAKQLPAFARDLLAKHGQPAQPAAETEIRRLLAYQYAGSALYRDDGELQDNRAVPFIDFLRDSPEQINEKMMKRAAAQPAASVEPDQEACQTCRGNGEIITDWERYKNPRTGDIGDEAVAECPNCDGTGKVGAAPVAAQPSVPDGWKLVPVEPTKEMINSGANAGGLGMDYHEWLGRALCAWPKMLAAAPHPTN